MSMSDGVEWSGVALAAALLGAAAAQFQRRPRTRHPAPRAHTTDDGNTRVMHGHAVVANQ
jgi:hypothetical protein